MTDVQESDPMAKSDGSSQVHKRLQDARERLAAVGENVGKKLHEARAGVTGERYEHAVENLRGGYDRVRGDMGRVAHDVNDYVQIHPAKALLIAAGLGFVLGLVFRGDGS